MRLPPPAFSAVYTSDLQRAWRTAELAGFPEAMRTPLLREFDYGEYEGLTSAQIHRQWPGWEIYADGCPGGETPGQIYARAEAFIRLLEGVDGSAVAFSHGHFCRAVAAAWSGLRIELATHLMLDPAGVGLLQDADHGRVIKYWNLAP